MQIAVDGNRWIKAPQEMVHSVRLALVEAQTALECEAKHTRLAKNPITVLQFQFTIRWDGHPAYAGARCAGS